MTNFSVYLHKSPSGKVYVGITKKKRVKDRWDNGNGYKNNIIFYRAINKYGWDNIEHIILFRDLSEKRAKNLEVDLIRHYKSLGISYNITDGGDGTYGWIPSEETKNKISSTLVGRVVPETVKVKISKALQGRKISKEHIDVIKRTHTGKVVSSETKQKLRDANLGKRLSDETRRKVALAFAKPVLQFSLDGIFIKEWESASEAARALGKFPSNIVHCCNKRLNYNTAYKYKWQWKH
jgi:group I intron endonuclease|nr:MAG TPA: intron associated endonuclease [Crassvirales sp.]